MEVLKVMVWRRRGGDAELKMLKVMVWRRCGGDADLKVEGDGLAKVWRCRDAGDDIRAVKV